MADGGCYCGSVRYALSGEAANMSICHCRDCQKSSGAASVAWIMAGEDDFTVTQGELKTVNGRGMAQRMFCGECGTGIAYLNSDILPGMIDIQIATLDEPHLFNPGANIQMAEQIGWEKTAHELPGFDRFPSEE